MKVFRIAKWSDVYTRAESRKLKQLTWVAMPVGFQSHGYQSLLDEFEDHAPAIYGAWCALISVAATCPVRGVLANSRGNPLKLSHIARMTGFPQSVFESLFQWASSQEVNWLEEISAEDLAAYIAENHEITNENRASGESPGNPPKLQGNPPTTRPNLTQPNITRQDPTPPDTTQSQVDAGAVAGELFEVDFEEVMRQCLKLDKALIKASCDAISADDLWKLGWVAQQLRPGLFSEVASKIASREIKRPRSYIESALRRECSERGLTLVVLSSEAPDRPRNQVA